MAINPNNITTIRVDQLAADVLNLTSEIPISNGSELKKSTVQDLVDFVATNVAVTAGVGYLPISVTDGQQLPTVPENPSFILVGKGTFLNTNGYPDIICTEELNVLMSLDDHWELAVEIPIDVETGELNYVEKAEFAHTNIATSGDINAISITTKNNKIRIQNADSISGIDFSSLNLLYTGKNYFIQNARTSGTVTIKHNSGTANYKFWFPNEEDLVLQPKEIVEFSLEITSFIGTGKLQYIGVATGGGGGGSQSLQDVITIGKTADEVEFTKLIMSPSTFGVDTENWYLFQKVTGGSFIVYGNFLNVNGGSTQRDICKFNADGTVDTTFNVGEGFDNNSPFGSTLTYEDGYGDVWIIGTFTNYKGETAQKLVVLNGSGNNIFGTSGFNDDAYVIASALYTDSVYIGGNFTSFKGTATPKGLIKVDVATKNKVTMLGATSFDLGVFGICVRDNGSSEEIIVSGYFTTYGVTSCQNVVILDEYGAMLNSTFGNFTIGTGTAVAYLKADYNLNRMIAFGEFDNYEDNISTNIPSLNIACVDLTTGEAADIFGSGFNGEVYSVDIMEAGGKYFINGAFTEYNGTPTLNSVILNTDGTIYKTFDVGGSYGCPDANRILGVNTSDTLIELSDGISINSQSLTFDKTTGKAEYFSGGVNSLSPTEVMNKRNVQQLIVETSISEADLLLKEDTANKATAMSGNITSNVVFLTAKAVYDWATGLFVQKNDSITGATKTKVTYDAKGLVTGGADADTDDIQESGTPTNKWWTNARTIASTLTGFVSGAGTVSSSDTILQAFQKIVGNMASHVTLTGTETLTNKRITKRVNSLTTDTTGYVLVTDDYDITKFTALANAQTFGTPSGTPTEGQMHLIKIKDDGSAKALGFPTGANQFASTTIDFPTTTVAGVWIDILIQWNSTNSKWECKAVV